jgi:hypothetical protein
MAKGNKLATITIKKSPVMTSVRRLKANSMSLRTKPQKTLMIEDSLLGQAHQSQPFGDWRNQGATLTQMTLYGLDQHHKASGIQGNKGLIQNPKGHGKSNNLAKATRLF